MHQAQQVVAVQAGKEMPHLEPVIDSAALLGPGLASPIRQAVKRIFDVVVALLLLGPLLPICLIGSLMIALDGGPIFFAQKRIGRGGRVFKCLKFRTMVLNAAEVLDHVLASDPEAREEWLRTRKVGNDPRITRIGKLLQATSIDELPKLINVLLGDMSLVGLRPVAHQERCEHRESDTPQHLLIRPGLTGLWQISGHNHTDDERRVLDSWYVRNWSLWGDIVILLRAIPVVVSGDY